MNSQISEIDESILETESISVDHLIVGINDLQVTMKNFERLGFIIKQGRAHPNGIENAFIEFKNNFEIEFIQVKDPKDYLASYYFKRITVREGPIYVSLSYNDLEGLKNILDKMNISCNISKNKSSHYLTFNESGLFNSIFFIRYLKPPQNDLEFTYHPNQVFEFVAIKMKGKSIDKKIKTLFPKSETNFNNGTIEISNLFEDGISVLVLKCESINKLKLMFSTNKIKFIERIVEGKQILVVAEVYDDFEIQFWGIKKPGPSLNLVILKNIIFIRDKL